MYRSKTILVVKNRHQFSKILKKQLEESGLDVVTARTSSQALSYLGDLKDIDSIWLDCCMLGEVESWDLLAKLKNEDAKWRRIPVIISDVDSKGNVRVYLHFGVEKYFIKVDLKFNEVVKSIKKSIKDGPTK